MEDKFRKPIVWIGSTRADLRAFPRAVQGNIGYALDLAQQGSRGAKTKPLKGFKGAGVLEIVEDFYGDTYRAVYTVQLQGVVLCCIVFRKRQRAVLPLLKRTWT